MKTKLVFLVLLTVLFSESATGQNQQLETLKKELEASDDDSKRSELLIQMSRTTQNRGEAIKYMDQSDSIFAALHW